MSRRRRRDRSDDAQNRFCLAGRRGAVLPRLRGARRLASGAGARPQNRHAGQSAGRDRRAGSQASRRQGLADHRPARRSGAGASRRDAGPARAASDSARRPGRQRVQNGNRGFLRLDAAHLDRRVHGKIPRSGSGGRRHHRTDRSRQSGRGAQRRGNVGRVRRRWRRRDAGGCAGPDLHQRQQQSARCDDRRRQWPAANQTGADQDDRHRENRRRSRAQRFQRRQRARHRGSGEGGLQCAIFAAWLNRHRHRRARSVGRLPGDATIDLRGQGICRRGGAGGNRRLCRRRATERSPRVDRREPETRRGRRSLFGRRWRL